MNFDIAALATCVNIGTRSWAFTIIKDFASFLYEASLAM